MDEFIKALVSPGKNPLIPEEENLYEQFIGEWDFDWFDHLESPVPRQVKGEWIFQWILEGLAIQDIFICPSRATRTTNPQPDAAYATTVRMYNPGKKAWDILYTEWGCATCLEGRRENGKLVQTVVSNDRLRWVFSEMTPHAFRWERQETEDGKNWKVAAYLRAVRKKEKESPTPLK